MNDGIATGERARNIGLIANIAFDLPETGFVTVGSEDVSTEIRDRGLSLRIQPLGAWARG